MIAAIERDDAAGDAASSTVILLGDLVDRGPQSAGVIDRALAWGRQRTVRLIGANHEEIMLEALSLDGNRDVSDIAAFRQFVQIGGRETILSYGVDPAAFDHATFDQARDLARAAVPAAHLAYLAAAESCICIGDYLFAHAGIRPGVGLAEQQDADLRWIRGAFLTSEADHGYVVVHGHTIVPEVAVRPNRIGIDTGAYRTGRLTALRLEGSDRELIEARREPDRPDAPIAIAHRSI